MEPKKERFGVNNYVIFKQGPEYYEGRIKSISIEGTVEMYQIFCFTTFTDLKVSSSEILYNLSQEVKRKIKYTAYGEIPNQTYIPPALRNVLIVDKEWAIQNRYELPHKIPVNMILKQFKDFLVNTANICDTDEANELFKGFSNTFNVFFKRYLIYPIEREQVNIMKGDPIEYCAPVHLLRLVYFMQKNINVFIKDVQVRNIILDSTIYLLDFMLFKYKEYF